MWSIWASVGLEVEIRLERLERHDVRVFCIGREGESAVVVSYHGIGGRGEEVGKVWVRERVARALSGVYGY